MKFAHEYEAALRHEAYPDHWIQTAISYRQLKKCINKFQIELSSIGLDADTLKNLWHFLKTSGSNGVPFQYQFEGNLTTFEPKLIFVVDSRNGFLVDASLSPETRAYLQGLADKNRHVPLREEENDQDSIPKAVIAENKNIVLGQLKARSVLEQDSSTERIVQDDYQKVEIPLKYDSEFFHTLKLELSGLHALQTYERSELTKEICSLGQEVAKLAAPGKGPTRTDLYAWREIFRLYTDCNIFFSTNEQEEFHRNSSTAQEQLQRFSNKLRELKPANSFRRKESYATLERFLLINITLLLNLKFQELNSIAMTKILKKFDKRTALGARRAFPDQISVETLSSQSLAKSLCYKISQEVLTLIPQLDDYLCPVCFNISFKPIRLQCGHVFCIRCMVIMQRAKEDHCPLCRGSVVMQADSENFDQALANFLKTFFPVEVKLKQKDNERKSGVDQYGEDYAKCAVM